MTKKCLLVPKKKVYLVPKQQINHYQYKTYKIYEMMKFKEKFMNLIKKFINLKKGIWNDEIYAMLSVEILDTVLTLDLTKIPYKYYL